MEHHSLFLLYLDPKGSTLPDLKEVSAVEATPSEQEYTVGGCA